jgi:tetratricopeptide (TPR) repeat protein
MHNVKKHLLACLIIAVLCAAVYGRSLGFPFTFDDALVISDNDFISSPSNLKELLSRNYFAISGEETYRPIVTISYYVDHMLWELNPVGYHLTNLTIHFLAAMALYAVGVLLLGGFPFALAAAAIFAAHPVNAEAVISPGFREDLLAGLFYFAAISLFMLSNRTRGRRGHSVYALCVLSYLLALFSKEMALSLPLFLLLLIWIAPSKLSGNRSSLWMRWGGLAAATVFYAVVRFVFLSNPAAVHAEYPGGSVGASMFTTARVFLSYIRVLIVPLGLSAEYSIAPSSPGDPHALVAVAVLLAIVVFALWRSRRWPVASLAILWFFIALIPVANIIPLYNIKADRYLYIPSAGFGLLLGAWGVNLANGARHAFRRRLPLYVLSGVALIFAFIAGSRALDWRSPVTLWSQVLVRNPASFRAHINLGRAFSQLQTYDEAISHYEQARTLRPDEPMLHNNLGVVYSLVGRPDLALEEFRKALELFPRYYKAQTNLALAYARLGQPDMAEEALAIAAGMRPLTAQTYARMGSVFLKTGETMRAREYLGTALRLSPADAIAHDAMGRLLLQEGDADGAIREHLAAVSANPRSFVGYLNLGNAYRAKGLTHEAEQAYARALQLNPSYWKAAYNLAVLAAERGDVYEAADLRREAIKMAPKEPAIYQRFTRLHLDIAKAYAAKGNSQAARHHYRAFLEAWQGDDALRQEALTALEKLDR